MFLCVFEMKVCAVSSVTWSVLCSSCRSDSVMADDEFIPFDPPIVSKYGPISRMSKTILRPNSSVQVSASFGDGTISTPMVRRPVPAASPVASWYFNAGQGKFQHISTFFFVKIAKHWGSTVTHSVQRQGCRLDGFWVLGRRHVSLQQHVNTVFNVHLCICPVGAGSFFMEENIQDMKVVPELCLVPKGNKEALLPLTNTCAWCGCLPQHGNNLNLPLLSTNISHHSIQVFTYCTLGTWFMWGLWKIIIHLIGTV